MRYTSDRAARVHQTLLILEATSVLRHDLRNRLAAMRNAAFYLERKVKSGAAELCDADPRMTTFFELIRSEAMAADALVTSSTPRTLPSEPAAEPVDVAALVGEVLAAEPAPAGVDLGFAADGPAWVQASPDELAVAIACLIDNAVEAVQAAGGGVVRIACARHGADVVVEVSDGGPGPGDGPPERWLPPFATSKPGHLGLGLAVARRVADRARGSLALVAGTGGARATLTLPAGDGR